MEGRVALPLRHNGVAYRGVNVLALWMQAMAKGYAAPVWMTFKQALNLGGCVRKGRSEEHTSELQSHLNLVCRLLLEKKKKQRRDTNHATHNHIQAIS